MRFRNWKEEDLEFERQAGEGHETPAAASAPGGGAGRLELVLKAAEREGVRGAQAKRRRAPSRPRTGRSWKAKAKDGPVWCASPHCPVTGLTNRRRFQEIVHVEWRRLMREGRPLSLIMFDIDEGDGNAAFYRSVAGSACLCRIAEVARGHARRAGDTAGRYGETRFGILLPGANTATARRIAEGLRRAIEAHWIAHPIPGASPAVTVHVGVATVVPSPISGPEDLLGRVEDAMYQAGFLGGNRVVGYRTQDTFGLVRWNLSGGWKPHRARARR